VTHLISQHNCNLHSHQLQQLLSLHLACFNLPASINMMLIYFFNDNNKIPPKWLFLMVPSRRSDKWWVICRWLVPQTTCVQSSLQIFHTDSSLTSGRSVWVQFLDFHSSPSVCDDDACVVAISSTHCLHSRNASWVYLKTDVAQNQSSPNVLRKGFMRSEVINMS